MDEILRKVLNVLTCYRIDKVLDKDNATEEVEFLKKEDNTYTITISNHSKHLVPLQRAYKCEYPSYIGFSECT